MLQHLQISNFTLVEQLDIEFKAGLTALTGETGAGKSILLDALSLVLGDRADADKVRTGAERADIQADFLLDKLPKAQRWLSENELGSDECLLRRVVGRDGRSRAYINGQTVTLQQIKALGDLLVDIHGQHEHQSLLKIHTHQRLLDEFAQHRDLAKAMKRAYYHWATCRDQLTARRAARDEGEAQQQLLRYQCDELEQLQLNEGEVDALELEQKQLVNIEELRQNTQHVLDICEDDELGLNSRLATALRLLRDLEVRSSALDSATTLLEQAAINIQEAVGDLERERDDDALDPARLPEIELRLSAIYELARKHRVKPTELNALHERIRAELEQLNGNDSLIDELESQLQQHLEDYRKHADKLSALRKKAAKLLGERINDQLAELAMPHARVVVELSPGPEQPSPTGNEQAQLLIATAPGQEPKALAKIASGGELSRVSLAIQVVTAQRSSTPTLIFDEVDVGIGGTTGNVVGYKLRELGERGQVICVTHLAQVASKAQHHLLVEKTLHSKGVNSSLTELDTEARVSEIARMMGGAIESEQSLAHAREMLSDV